MTFTLIGLALLVMKTVSLLIHNVIYSYNGKGIMLLRLYSVMASQLSQLSISFLFLVFAFGWGTVRKNESIVAVSDS